MRFFRDKGNFSKIKSIVTYESIKTLMKKERIEYKEINFDEDEAKNGRHTYTYTSPFTGNTIVITTQDNFEFTFIDFWQEDVA